MTTRETSHGWTAPNKLKETQINIMIKRKTKNEEQLEGVIDCKNTGTGNMKAQRIQNKSVSQNKTENLKSHYNEKCKRQ